VAAPTPFTSEGALDERLWREELRLYHGQGVHGILVNGTTGEWFSQSDAERRRVAEIAVDELRGKIPVVIGCTTYTAAHSAELGRHATHIGADGSLHSPPPRGAHPREIVAFTRRSPTASTAAHGLQPGPRRSGGDHRGHGAELTKIDHVVAIGQHGEPDAGVATPREDRGQDPCVRRFHQPARSPRCAPRRRRQHRRRRAGAPFAVAFTRRSGAATSPRRAPANTWR
jgi:4-hydroxy-tetrahydrodipicolinate synthase